MHRNPRGFTLVEILIVVIILGILAAIVIPQFTNASNDARNSSVASTLQTVRSQIELYKIQHSDAPPTDTNMWTQMLSASNSSGSLSTSADSTYPLGPYMQAAPLNPVNGNSVCTNAGPAAGVGWVYIVTGTQYTIQAVDTTGDAVLTY